ncbi:MAG: response regulator [Desulfuromonas sp.]|nr:response regulator [Desulfuromonas sp.]
MSKRLLLADDSVTIQKVIEITFADKDYQLKTADNGDDAFAMAQNERPDLILADVFMPGKDGYELCEAVRNQPDLSNVPVLLLAGTFEPFDEAKATACGASGWITKPFRSQDLVDKVAELLANAPVIETWQAAASQAPVENDILGALEEVAAAQPATDVAAPDLVPIEVPAAEPAAATSADPFSFDAPAEVETPVAAEPFEFESQPVETSDSSLDPFAAPQQDDTTSVDLPPISEFSFDSDPVAATEPAVADPFATSEPVAAEPMVDLPPLDSFTSTEPEPAPEAVVETAAPAGVVDLQANDIVAEGAYGATPARVETRVAYLSDEQLNEIVERIAGKVIEKLAAPILEQVVWEVVPDLAESMVREEMSKIKEQV